MNEIESQTNLLFIYNKNVNVNREVSIEAKNTILDEVLKKLFDKDVIYKIEGSYIVLSPSSQTEMKQQAEMIKGTVADQKGNPIIGANIVEKGNPANGTITDVNGNYSLAVSGNAVLVASYIGYNKIEIPVNDRSVVDIVLTEDMQVLGEVVVVGHSTQKKSI
ncbi:MAG: carboxypeptidase-like regulatory domain-containing protein [Parabacteroides sp.]|nr:carboxypeptidase-like regulatory domain-containing protein [Parabacteroides sp.]